MLKKLTDLLKLAKKLPIQRVAVVAAEDEAVIDAISEADSKGLIIPILIGDEQKIKAILSKKGIGENTIIINSESLEQSAQIAVEMIRSKKADLLMKGLVDTKILLKEVVNRETGIKESPLLSHVAILSFPNRNVLFATDCAMVIAPTVEEKAAIIKNAVRLAKTLGYDQPKVGLVSAVEKVNPKIQSTQDAADVVALFQKENTADCIIDGPFAIDNLVSEKAAKHKNIESKVAGKADILVFPNIDAGNVFYKTSVFLGKAEVAGIVIGASVPIVLTSRADSSKSKLFSILLALVYNHGKSNSSN